MRKKKTFTFRISPAESTVLEMLAYKLRRSQSDTVRWLITEAASGYRIDLSEIEKESNENHRILKIPKSPSNHSDIHDV